MREEISILIKSHDLFCPNFPYRGRSASLGAYMQVTVTLEFRFAQLPDGTLWTPTTFPYRFWERYLEVFDRVQIVARAEPVDSVPPNWKEATGPQVIASAVPYYIGPLQYLTRYRAVSSAISRTFTHGDAVLLRLSSRIGTVMRAELNRRDYPYGVEVVADPYDVFSPGAMRHPLRPFLRIGGFIGLRRACANAAVGAYVTEEALQLRYPGGDDTAMFGFSDVELSDDVIKEKGRTVREVPKPLRIMMVGGINQLYKAPHILVDAFALVVRQLDASLIFVGGGQYREFLQQRANALGVGDRVSFAGEISGGAAVIAMLDTADLFVLPSFQEGLPRAMVEAMARGIPCIGSSVGGIPELLPAEDTVPAGDKEALAKKIVEVGLNPKRLTEMSNRNISRARDFVEDAIRPRRIAFYTRLRKITEQHIESRK